MCFLSIEVELSQWFPSAKGYPAEINSLLSGSRLLEKNLTLHSTTLMASLTCDGIPNPLAPQALLPPQVAHELEVSTLMYAGCTGVLIWDILSNLSIDADLLLKRRIQLPAIVYVLSRFATLGFMLAACIFRTVPVGHCRASAHVVNSFIPLAASSTCLLFFFRIRAVFNANRIIVAVFFTLWLGVVGSTITIPVAFRGGHIGPTEYCVFTRIEQFTVIASIVPLVHDTCVFFSISWRLLQNSHVDYRSTGVAEALKIFLSGRHLPAFSKALLQDGQKYYLMTVISNLLVVIMIFVPGLSNAYHTMFMVPNIMITNCMACLVYRKTKQGLILEDSISTTSGLFTSRQPNISLRTFPHSDGNAPQIEISKNAAVDRNVEDELLETSESPFPGAKYDSSV